MSRGNGDKVQVFACLFCWKERASQPATGGRSVSESKGLICSPPGACFVCEMKHGCSKLISFGYAWKLDNPKRKEGSSSEQRSILNFTLRLFGQAFLLTGFWTTDWLSGDDIVSRQSYWFLGLVQSQMGLLDCGTEQPKAGHTAASRCLCSTWGSCDRESERFGGQGLSCPVSVLTACVSLKRRHSQWEVLAAVCCC